MYRYPVVPDANQPLSETIEVPASSSKKRLNVLGFYSIDNRFESCSEEGSVDLSRVIACFNDFCKVLTKKTFVVIDNASVHTSKEFFEPIPKWESKNLIIKYLPPVSKEINLIEILWRFIKYSLIPFSAYLSFETLVFDIENVLKNIGSSFQSILPELEPLLGTYYT